MNGASDTYSLGPVEFIVVTFDGNSFDGSVASELAALTETGMIRVIDLAVVSKDADGAVTIFEMQELSAELAGALVKLAGDVPGLLSEADILDIAQTLPPSTTAATMLFEHVWATRFAEAVRAANGRLVASERIPHAVMIEARATLIAAAG